MKKNSDGFGAVTALLIFVILVLVGLVGFLAYKNISKETIEPEANTQLQNQAVPNANESSNTDLTKEQALQLFVDGSGGSRPANVSTPTIKQSATAGYRTAEVGMGGDGGGFMALFYQTPDNTWHFFTGTQNELVCSRYETTDLKKAYAGERCIIDGGVDGEGTVTVD